MYAILKTVLYFSGFFFILQSCTETAAENTSKEVITQTEEVKINPDVKQEKKCLKPSVSACFLW